jgi:hypothetical protein
MSYFDDKYENISPIPKLLPYFHSCDAFVFKKILEDKKLLVSECKVFNNEKLLYLFYGKPAYKSSNTDSTKLNSNLPICFILNSEYICNIKRIIPFDSGAFECGLYKEYLHPHMKLEYFLMHPEQKSISKTINYFYESNGNYFMFKPKEQIQYDPLDFEIESYHNLIKGVSRSSADDRKASIEIQLDQNIEINSDALKAVILPSNFTLSSLVQKVLIEECNAKIITYENYGVGSSLYYTKILDLTKDYLTEQELV